MGSAGRNWRANRYANRFLMPADEIGRADTTITGGRQGDV